MNEQVVLITGGSRGIGKAMVRSFANAGYTVIFTYYQNNEAALALVEEIEQQGHMIMAVRGDVAHPQDVQELFLGIEQIFGGVDILINNAGIAQQMMFTDISYEQWRRMMAVTLDGAYFCSQGALPYMIGNKAGKIINISSMWGQVGASCEVHYSTAKAGLIGMTKALAKELGPSNIQVNCIAPGVIATEMNGNLTTEEMEQLREETPLGTIGQPEDIAQMALFLASPQANFITGQVIGCNGGLII